MRRLILTTAALTLAGGLAACSKAEETSAAPAVAPAATSDVGGVATPAQAKGTGTVTAVSADSITVDHAPIPEAGWPAMTMAFKASPDLAKSVKAGDKVAFDLKLQGGAGEITGIQTQ
ncbi:copper-binding protein [Phenylobacterium sp.]|uniref:copper-binding protein n=1 Tax=Phenylobacterium sp. TaxID=1871053 RepID=UPI0039837FBF